MREDGQALPRLTRFAAQAGEEAQAFGLRLCVGVSDVFTSVTALHTAFLRARLALRPTADGELSVYAQEGGEEFDGMKMADLSRLQHLLIACDAEKALAQLRSLLQNARSSSDSTPDPSIATSYSKRLPPVKNV